MDEEEYDEIREEIIEDYNENFLALVGNLDIDRDEIKRRTKIRIDSIAHDKYAEVKKIKYE